MLASEKGHGGLPPIMETLITLITGVVVQFLVSVTELLIWSATIVRNWKVVIEDLNDGVPQFVRNDDITINIIHHQALASHHGRAGTAFIIYMLYIL